jgi:hypothetical protein
MNKSFWLVIGASLVATFATAASASSPTVTGRSPPKGVFSVRNLLADYSVHDGQYVIVRGILRPNFEGADSLVDESCGWVCNFGSISLHIPDRFRDQIYGQLSAAGNRCFDLVVIAGGESDDSEISQSPDQKFVRPS